MQFINAQNQDVTFNVWRQLKKVADDNNDGTITKGELVRNRKQLIARTIFTEFGVNEMIRQAADIDNNGKGGIQMGEWRQFRDKMLKPENISSFEKYFELALKRSSSPSPPQPNYPTPSYPDSDPPAYPYSPGNDSDY